MAVLGIYKKYISEKFNEKGEIIDYKLHAPDTFNFAYDVVDVLGEKTPDRRAMRWTDDAGDCIDFTFRDIKTASDKAASFFQSLGIKKGDKVMLILRRHYQFWFAILGLHKIGAVAIPATYQLKEDDLIYRFQSADVSTIICTGEADVSDEVDKALKHFDQPVRKIMVHGRKSGWLDFDLGLLLAKDFQPLPIDQRACGSDLMLLYFTSGTEGEPKMVQHSYYYPIAHIPTAKYWQKVDPDGLHLTVSDTGWAKSVWGKLYGQWLMEAGVYVFDFNIFNPGRMLSHMEKDGITTFCAPPTTYRYLIHEGLDNYDLSQLQHLTTAGEALSPDLFAECKRQTGMEIKEGFGQTETVLSVATFYWMKSKPNSMGKPVKTYPVVLLNDNGEECKAGESGEICIKTEPGAKNFGIFQGYAGENADEINASVWHDGFYHTRDRALIDEDGYIYYIGRIDDMIKTSGFRVGPFEVESVILEHPAVLEVAVTGIPDKNRGNILKATVKLNKGYKPSKQLAQEIKKYSRSRIALYKAPRLIEFTDELPKTESGKIKRQEIKERDLRRIAAGEHIGI